MPIADVEVFIKISAFYCNANLIWYQKCSIPYSQWCTCKVYDGIIITPMHHMKISTYIETIITHMYDSLTILL